MRILVTGGSGMLGQTLRYVFLSSRPDIELLTPSHAELDLVSASAVREYLRHFRPDLVIHCAARVGGIQANIDNPTEFLYDNAMMSLNIVDATAKAGIRDLIYIGSSCMYPRDYVNPLREEYLLAAPLEPTNEGYALAKLVGAKLCQYHNLQFDTNFKTLIPCNLYGQYDHFDPVKSHLVAAILLKLHEAKQEGKDTVSIWGDGTVRREFLYCQDLAEFICDSIEKTSSFPNYLNVGYGRDFSVLEYYQIGSEVVGFRGSLETDSRRPAGMRFKLLDSSRASSYGWKPRTPLRDGMAKVYAYFLRTQGACG